VDGHTALVNMKDFWFSRQWRYMSCNAM